MEYIIQIQLETLEYLHVKILDFILYLSTQQQVAKMGFYNVYKNNVHIAAGCSSLAGFF